MMEIALDLNMPYYLDRAARGGVNIRATFKRMLESRIRRYMNTQRDRARQVTRFERIADQFFVEQQTEGDTLTWRFGNRSSVARYLEAREGVAPHTIVQAPHLIPFGKLLPWAEGITNLRGDGLGAVGLAAYTRALHSPTAGNEEIVIEHPGIEPDEPVWDIVAEMADEIPRIAHRALMDWGRRYGQEAQ